MHSIIYTSSVITHKAGSLGEPGILSVRNKKGSDLVTGTYDSKWTHIETKAL